MSKQKEQMSGADESASAIHEASVYSKQQSPPKNIFPVLNYIKEKQQISRLKLKM